MSNNGIDADLTIKVNFNSTNELESGDETAKQVENKVQTKILKEDDFTKEDDYLEIDLSLDDNTETKVDETDETTDVVDDKKTDDKKTDEKSDEKSVDETDDDSGITFEDFKDAIQILKDGTIVKASDKAFEKLFNSIDANKNELISEDELKELGIKATCIEELTVDDIKIIAKKAGLPVKDSTKDAETDETDEDELPSDLLEKLKETFGVTNDTSSDETADNAITSPSETGSYSNDTYTPSYDTGAVSNASSVGYSGGVSNSGGSYGNSNAYSSQNASTTADADKLSLDELKTQQTQKQTAVDNAQSALSDITSGNNENVKAATDECKQKEEAYSKALENDKKVSEELKEKQKQNSENISTKENEIKDEQTGISEDEQKIYNLENEISSLNSQLEAYRTSLSNLPQKTSDNENKHSEIDAMKKQIEDSISSINEQIKSKEDEKNTTDEDKKQREEKLKTLNDELKKLQDERDEIEKEISNTCSDETKAALSEYQKARENAQTIKTEETNKAQSTLETAKSELEQVNASIQELEAMQIQLQNRIGDSGEDVVEFAKKLDGLSASEMKQIMQAAGCQFDSGAWCADFCTYVTKQVYGKDSTPGDFANSCANTAYCPTIGSWARNNGVYTTDSSKVQPGDYILYGSAGSERHIGIVTSVNADGTVNTIEGNTSDDNGRYTDGVVNQHFNKTGAYVLMHELV